MALEFNGFEPVRFGEITEAPVVNRELILKIQNGVKNGANDDAFRELLAEAFPVNRTAILDFLKNKMSGYDVARLATYLVGGDTMVSTLDQARLENAKDTMREVTKGE